VVAVHLVSRALALLVQFGLLIVLFYIGVTDGGIILVKYCYVKAFSQPSPALGVPGVITSVFLDYMRYHKQY
jgi:hypothetical protein